ncbi:MAG TPA: hypothetical protein VJP85_14065 [Candidatus Baltobacteraceae bacterium]|nr:hypothetical protein [Candidatus Baltobacteraceae bacterium]
MGFYAHPEIAIKIKSVFVKVPPKAAQGGPPSKRANAAFVADAGWALSVLPECFTQTSKSTGPLKYVLANLPAGASMLRPGASVESADCRVNVTADTVVVTRGFDRLRVPPIARLYQAAGHVALLRGADDGFELRVYETMAAPTGRL